jgi:hypothetical protein
VKLPAGLALGDYTVSIANNQGKNTVMLAGNGGDKKSGYLILSDGQSRKAAVLGSDTDSGDGFMNLFSGGTLTAALDFSPTAGTQLRLIGDGKYPTVGLRSFNNGSATLSLNFGATKAFDVSSSQSNGSLAGFYNPSGKLAVYMGATTSGSGFSRYYDGDNERIYVGGTVDGGAVVQIGTDAKSAAVSMGQRKDGSGYIKVGDKMVADFAEVFEVGDRAGIVPGTVLSSDSTAKLGPSSRPCDPLVVGVVSGANGLRPGMIIGAREDGSTDLPVAVAGRVYVRANGEGGPIKAGDLLTSSGTPGVAMRAEDPKSAVGCTIGKAMSDLPEGGGEHMILMLVFNR